MDGGRRCHPNLGAGQTKKLEIEASYHERLEQMEDTVKEAVMNGTEDVVLSLMIETAISSFQTGQPIFSTLSEEPLFFRRYFKRWVREAMADIAALKKAEQYGADELARTLQAS